MELRTANDVQFICDILWKGYCESYSPNKSLIETTKGRILRFLELLHRLDKDNTNNGICYYDKDTQTLYTSSAWRQKIRTQEVLREEVRTAHVETKCKLARKAILAAAIRRRLGSSCDDKFADTMALIWIKKNNKAALKALEIDVEILTMEITDPDEWL